MAGRESRRYTENGETSRAFTKQSKLEIMNPQAEKFLSTLDRSDRTIETYRWALDYYFNLVGEELSDKNYEKFLIAIRKLSPSSKSVLRSAVMGLYEFLEIGDLAKRARLNHHYARKSKVQPVNFDRDAVEKIVEYCGQLGPDIEGLRDRAFVLTLVDSGFRISELVGLKRGDIDWKEERVAIVGKGDKAAVVRLSKRSVQALRDYMSARAKLDGESGKPLNSLPLFAQHGRINFTKPMSIDGMRQAIKGHMKDIGVNVRIHDFRHYFVTMVMLADGNLKTAQVLARHESIKTTSRYAHMNESEIDQKYDEIFNRR
jgi:integrase/recombinase XerC